MEFSEWLRQEMQDRGMGLRELAREARLSPSTISKILNEYRGAGPEFCQAIARALKLPVEEVYRQAGLLPAPAACDRSRAYRHGKVKNSSHERPTALRDRAILLLLLDTGLRATELCNLTIADLDAKNQQIITLGKGKKERTLPIDARTLQAIWKYLRSRPVTQPHDPLFCTSTDRPLDRTALRQLLINIGQRAGVKHLHPHRFRHTFAITYLRNDGDIYTLQRMLGHTSLEMVRRYLAIAQTDIDAAHRRASPVANWRL